jgi:hypothetical protein
MPLELSVWRISDGLDKMVFAPLDLEARLQDILVKDISIADPNLMVIGNEVITGYGNRIDILAINRDGHLIVFELKRNKTPREIVAQVLDYGSWVRTLHNEDIAKIFSEFQRTQAQGENELSIDEAFCKRFNVKEMPDELNEEHQLVIVASYLDASTERIVSYLAEEHDVKINALFFRVFKDGKSEYLTRVWFLDPNAPEIVAGKNADDKEDWNGEYYVSFGNNEDHRAWSDAVKYGFISGGFGTWYTNTLSLLSVGDRIWVNVPGEGYVGVGKVTEERVPVDEFMVIDEDGKKTPIWKLKNCTARMPKASTDPEQAEYLVRVKWIKTLTLDNAIKEKGFFGNQNTVARPRSAKWKYTVDRLKKIFNVN